MFPAAALCCLLIADPGAGNAPSRCTDPASNQCTLRDWMKLNLQSNLDRADYGRLAWSLRRLADATRRLDRDWFTMARSAAIAAEKKDQAAVRAQCKACHEAFREPRRWPIGRRP